MERLAHLHDFNHYQWMLGDDVAHNEDHLTYCYAVANDGGIMNAGNPQDESLCVMNVGAKPTYSTYLWLQDGRCYAKHSRSGEFLNRRRWVEPRFCQYSPVYRVRTRGTVLSQNDANPFGLTKKPFDMKNVDEDSVDSKMIAFGNSDENGPKSASPAPGRSVVD
ncbi:MAG: hypothetical protein HY074_08335 [Deltaproteobacteria bacterium]|nr:hypothetical protein [Deltaproteobacteria bacterium]